MSDLVALDPVGTHNGLLERLCLHETITPAFPTYNSADSLKAMWFIRQMLANRVRYPRVFGNKADITEAGVMKLKNQFPGFESYPILAAGEMANVTECVRLANDPKGWRHAAFLQHVQNAVTVAQAATVPGDQIVVEAAGWKKHGAPSPGGRYVFWRTLQGNDYYITPMTDNP